MKLQRIFMAVFAGLCLFHILSQVVRAQELMYFLLDKSGSMGAIEPDTDKTVLTLAKERIYDTIKSLPPDPGRRTVKIILFDSELCSFLEKEVISVQDARNFLDMISPGGNTTIGDRLEEVRQEILATGVKSVELHLFSDLKETVPGKVSKEEAINNLNHSMSDELKHVRWTLFMYTWKGGPAPDDTVFPSSTPLPLTKKPLRIILESPDSFVLDLTEKNGRFVDVTEGVTSLRGTIDPEVLKVLNKKFVMRVKASLPEFPQARVLINGQREYNVTRHADLKTGQFKQNEVKIKIQNFHSYLNQGISLLGKNYKVNFEPILEPDSATLKQQFKDQVIDLPSSHEVPFRFTTKPVIYVRNYPPPKRLVRRLFEGQSLKEPLELAWNLGAVGKRLRWSLPDNLGYFTTSKGRELESFELDNSLGRVVVYHWNSVQTLSDKKIIFTVHGALGKEAEANIPFSVEAVRPSLDLKFRDDLPPIPLAAKSVEISDGLIVVPNASNIRLPLELKVERCKGSACSGLKFAVMDPFDPAIDIQLGDGAVRFNITNPLWLNYRVGADRPGRAQVIITAGSEGYNVNTGDQSGHVVKTVNLNIIKPELTWKIINTEDDKELPLPLCFVSRGEDVTTNDPDLIERGYIVSASLNTQFLEGFQDVFLTMVVQSNKEKDDEHFVTGAKFNATDSKSCEIGQFIDNPHIILEIDESKKPWWGTKRERVKIFFKSDNVTSQKMKLPVIPFNVRLRP
jgi:hypothetical protein